MLDQRLKSVRIPAVIWWNAAHQRVARNWREGLSWPDMVVIYLSIAKAIQNTCARNVTDRQLAPAGVAICFMMMPKTPVRSGRMGTYYLSIDIAGGIVRQQTWDSAVGTPLQSKYWGREERNETQH